MGNSRNAIAVSLLKTLELSNKYALSKNKTHLEINDIPRDEQHTSRKCSH